MLMSRSSRDHKLKDLSGTLRLGEGVGPGALYALWLGNPKIGFIVGVLLVLIWVRRFSNVRLAKFSYEVLWKRGQMSRMVA